MWRCLVSLSLFAACSSDGDRRPTFPDVDGGLRPDGPEPDAPPDGPPPRITGKVCLLLDLRDLTTCDPVGPGALEITLGSNTTTSTAGTGAFSIEPDPAGAHWTVRGAGARTSRVAVVPGQTTGVILPLIADDRYDALVAANGIVEGKGTGSAVLTHRRAGSPLPGVLITTDITTATLRYDGTDATVWDLDATGPRGMAWVTNLPAGTAMLTSDIAVGMDIDSVLPIEDQGITFLAIEDL